MIDKFFNLLVDLAGWFEDLTDEIEHTWTVGDVFWRLICAPIGFLHVAYQLGHLFVLVMDEIFC